jgi:hypothetical protein
MNRAADIGRGEKKARREMPPCKLYRRAGNCRIGKTIYPPPIVQRGRTKSPKNHPPKNPQNLADTDTLITLSVADTFITLSVIFFFTYIRFSQ